MMQTLTKPKNTSTAPASTTATSTTPAVVTSSDSASSALPLFSDDAPQQVSIEWLDSGKPTLNSESLAGVETSLSHDDHACLCVVGEGPQGCDLAPVTERSQASWLALLTAKRESLLQALTTSGDSIDIAGSRIWAATEAAVKAIGPEAKFSLIIEQRDGDSVLFGASLKGQYLYILTFPIQLAQSPQRIVAVVVTKQK